MQGMSQALPAHLLPFFIALGAAIVLLATLEGVVLRFVLKRAYDWKAYAANIADAIGRRAVDLLGLSLAFPVIAWAHAHRVATLDLSTGGQWLLLFVGQEFCYYWYHRAAHRVRWFWASHTVHHSPNELTLAAALRLGWTGKLTGTGLFFVPLVWLGFEPIVALGMLGLNLLYQFWIHATWIPKLGPLEWVFNTPSHHRVHHASNAAYLDCNYGGVLIVFDRLFGTFVAEREDLPPVYGLTTPLHSYNPFRIALHGWLALGRDLLAVRKPMDLLRTLFGPPPALQSPASAAANPSPGRIHDAHHPSIAAAGHAGQSAGHATGVAGPAGR
jgi:sterol desaturase/sphingolipid hydroxylase (fatty acid hydroxylase superfamily)